MQNDTQHLEGLLEYLDEWQGAIAHVEEVLNAKPTQIEKKRATFEKNFGASPEVALKNALNGLTREVLAVKAARALAEMEASNDTAATPEVSAYMSAIGARKTETKTASSRANAAKAAQARKRDPLTLPCTCTGGDSLEASDHKTTCPRGRLLRQRARNEAQKAT